MAKKNHMRKHQFLKGVLIIIAALATMSTLCSCDNNDTKSSSNEAILSAKSTSVLINPTSTPTLVTTSKPIPTPTVAPTPKPTQTPLETKNVNVTITYSCSGYNSVGNSWTKHSSIDGIPIATGDVITITLNNSIEIYTKITENDTVPDIGTATNSEKITQARFDDGFSITQTVIVKENRGRYSGNTAVWTVKYTFRP